MRSETVEGKRYYANLLAVSVVVALEREVSGDGAEDDLGGGL